MTEVEVLAGQRGWAIARRARRLNGLKSRLAVGDLRPIEAEANAFLAKQHLQLDHDDPRYRELSSALIGAKSSCLSAPPRVTRATSPVP